MERKIFFLFVMFLFSIPSFSQSDPIIYKAYTTGKMNLWKDKLDSKLSIKNKSTEEKLDLINFLYGYIGWSIGKGNKKDAKYYINEHNKLLLSLEKSGMENSLLYCYKSAEIGFEIGLAFYKAPFIGPKSIEFADKSLALDSSSVFAYLQKGNIKFYTPKIFGGSKKEAVEYYKKAFNLMLAGDYEIKNNWNYLNMYAILITAHMELDDYETALEYSEKVLAIEPNFKWVKETLKPKILKELKE